MTETNVFALTAALHIALRTNTQQTVVSGCIKLLITKQFVREITTIAAFLFSLGKFSGLVKRQSYTWRLFSFHTIIPERLNARKSR